MHYPATRLLTVLKWLQARPEISGVELANHLEVDPRTIRRYIIKLQDMGYSIETRRGPHGAYRLRPGYRLPPLTFTDDQAFAVTIGLIAAQKLGLAVAAPAVEGALAEIERVLPLKLQEQVRAVQEALVFDMQLSRAIPSTELVLMLCRAVQQERRVWMRYQAWRASETEREVDLYGVVYRSGFWYAVGYCHLRADIRVFRLDRIVEAVLRDETFVSPADFNCLEYIVHSLATMPAGWTVEVLLELTLEEAQQRISPIIATLEQESDGVAFRCYAETLEWVAYFLIGLRCPFIVRQPEELRDTLRKVAEQIILAASKAE